MGISSKIKTIFRGDVPFTDLPREALRRKKASDHKKNERGQIDKINRTPAQFTPHFASLKAVELLTHFRERTRPNLWIAADERECVAKLQREMLPRETAKLIESASRIVRESSWELAGFGILEFKAENVWRRDPLNGKVWGLEYHADVVLDNDDGSDIRVLWELNRFGHAIDLARAFAITNDEIYAETFFSHIESWMRQNPYGRGANWSCAMEVALRAVNLLAAFDIFRGSKAFTEERLEQILRLIDQHGRFILNNNEFSYISTSNHYMSNVVGLFWIGTLLPELEHASEWKDFGVGEMLREMDKQILPDGSDFESSTGYHKFVAELLLLSFLLAEKNGVEIPATHRGKLRPMFEYIQAIRRPDGRMPLIGDADGSQIIPVVKRNADDQAYLLNLAAVVFNEPRFKTSDAVSPEVIWFLGSEGAAKFDSFETNVYSPASCESRDAGAYILRDGDLYLHFNCNDCGINGRGSHGHNDALSIELSAYGRAFIIDPGSYVYNLDRRARQVFRSTAYHSTVMIDALEQNTTEIDQPFVMGNEAHPNVLEWETNQNSDRVAAEHFGYKRLPHPVVHRRTVEFNKVEKYWIVEDRFAGKGQHDLSFCFHVAPGLSVKQIDGATVLLADDSGRKLLIQAIGIHEKSEIAEAHVSRNYGHREDSLLLRWNVAASAPFSARFLLIPSGPNDNVQSRLEIADRLIDNI